MRKVFLFFTICLTLVACSKDNLRLRKQIAQMLCVGFHGSNPEELEAERNGVKYYVEELGIGGVILFQRNIVSPQQLSELNTYLQGLCKESLLLAVDHEGGHVNRFPQEFGFPDISADSLGKISLSEVTAYSHKVAQILKSYQFNTNFAPCVDVNVNPQCPVIAGLGRSFSADPKVVIDCSREWIQAHRSFGIMSSIKHFPGHGSSDTDSHIGFTDVSDTWKEYELEPYKKLVEEDLADMVMISHVFNNNIDPDYPATLSPKVVQGLLREQIGFEGVVVSDDLTMGAMTTQYTNEEVYQRAINAGIDMLIIANNSNDQKLIRKTINIIYRLVKKGAIPRQRIEESYDRIIKMKNQWIQN